MTHTFHPLRGQAFEAITVRNNWGGDRVSYLDAKGRLRTLPVEWTDIQGPDPVIAVVSTLLTGAVLLGVLVSLFFRQGTAKRSANAA